MGRLALLLTVLVTLGVGTCAVGAGVAGDNGIVPAPALHIPYGGQVVTDINVAEGDVLGMARQMLPVLIETAKPLAASKLVSGVVEPGVLQALDIKPLIEAVAGVTNVRVIVSKFAKSVSSAKMVKDVDAGVAKIGKFSRVMEDTQSTPGFLLVYAQDDGGGYVGFAFDPSARELYAARVVGSVDVPKLAAWAMDIATKFGVQSKSTTVLSTQPPASPEAPAK